jgi:hypothetical protein
VGTLKTLERTPCEHEGRACSRGREDDGGRAELNIPTSDYPDHRGRCVDIAGQRTRRLRRSLRAPKDSGGRVDPFGRNDRRCGRHHCQGARLIQMDRLCWFFCNPNRLPAYDSGR